MPALASVALLIVGLGKLDEKPLVPLQLYDVPLFADSCMVCPAHTGLLFVTIGLTPLTVTIVDAVFVQPLALVTVTV